MPFESDLLHLSAGRKTPIIFRSDLVYILLMSVMGVSGGFLSGKAMAFAGQIAPKHLQDDTGDCESSV